MSSADEVLLELSLRSDGDAVLRVSVGKYHGRARVDIRTFYRYSDETERVATRRGVVLTAEQLPAVIDALEEAAATMEGRPSRSPAAGADVSLATHKGKRGRDRRRTVAP